MNIFSFRYILLVSTFVLYLSILCSVLPVTVSAEESVPVDALDVKNLGVMGNGITDDTLNIQSAIDTAYSLGKNLYFPTGTYKITGNLIPKNGVSFLGSKNDITIFDASSQSYFVKIMDTVNEVKKVQFKNIVFINMGIHFSGKLKGEDDVLYCAFIDGKPSSSNGLEYYLNFQHGNYKIHSNVFLRGNNYPGFGITFYKSINSEVKNNYFGGIDKWDYANPMLTSDVKSVLQKLYILYARKNLDPAEEQGNFKTAINGINYDQNLKIQNNFIWGNKGGLCNSAETRDHSLYIKGYTGLEIVGNYIRGWETDPSGGIKIRNGKKATVVSNYLDDHALLLYVYNNHETLELSNTFIYNNYYNSKTNYGKWGSGMSYGQNFPDSPNQKATLKNNIFYRNKFSNQNDQILFWNQIPNQFQYRQNVYTQTNQLVKVIGNPGETDEQSILRQAPENFSELQYIPIPLYSEGVLAP
ncbi:glycosyl hydrolase family 28-related protein [Bacillus cereus group sp. IBL03679]|uniref:glycosyl hydrolase family 28-related protein n=1 Tax=Bacillus cereus group sp. IBL03679 TaxID=3240095 RepID=UPI003D2F6050